MEGVISVRADEMSVRMLALAMVISTDKFEILLLRDQYSEFKPGKDKIFNMILEIGGPPEGNRGQDMKMNLMEYEKRMEIKIAEKGRKDSETQVHNGRQQRTGTKRREGGDEKHEVTTQQNRSKRKDYDMPWMQI